MDELAVRFPAVFAARLPAEKERLQWQDFTIDCSYRKTHGQVAHDQGACRCETPRFRPEMGSGSSNCEQFALLKSFRNFQSNIIPLEHEQHEDQRSEQWKSEGRDRQHEKHLAGKLAKEQVMGMSSHRPSDEKEVRCRNC